MKTDVTLAAAQARVLDPHSDSHLEAKQLGKSYGSRHVVKDVSLMVRKGEVVVTTVTKPGALIGEISLLLNRRYSATVVAHLVIDE